MRQKLKQEILYRIYVSVFRREKEIAVYKAAKSVNDEMKMKLIRDTAQFYHGAKFEPNGHTVCPKCRSANAVRYYLRKKK